MTAELACLRQMKTELFLAWHRPAERAGAVGDEAIDRHAHRKDQHRHERTAPKPPTMIIIETSAHFLHVNTRGAGLTTLSEVDPLRSVLGLEGINAGPIAATTLI